MTCDGEVSSFTPFHNVGCYHGFIYFTATVPLPPFPPLTISQTLKMCQLYSGTSYDNVWPVRKIHLRCTPHKIIYHKEAKTYALIVSSKAVRVLQPPPALPNPADVEQDREDRLQEERERIERERERYGKKNCGI
jgi:hypothetical protein